MGIVAAGGRRQRWQRTGGSGRSEHRGDAILDGELLARLGADELRLDDRMVGGEARERRGVGHPVMEGADPRVVLGGDEAAEGAPVEEDEVLGDLVVVAPRVQLVRRRRQVQLRLWRPALQRRDGSWKLGVALATGRR